MGCYTFIFTSDRQKEAVQIESAKHFEYSESELQICYTFEVLTQKQGVLKKGLFTLLCLRSTGVYSRGSKNRQVLTKVN